MFWKSFFRFGFLAALVITAELFSEPFLTGDVVYYSNETDKAKQRLGFFVGRSLDKSVWVFDQLTRHLDRATEIKAFPVREGDFVRFQKPGGPSSWHAFGYVMGIEPSGTFVIHSFNGPPFQLTLPREKVHAVDITGQVFFAPDHLGLYRVSKHQMIPHEIKLETFSPASPLALEPPRLPEHLIQCYWIFPEGGFTGPTNDFTQDVVFFSGRAKTLIVVNIVQSKRHGIYVDRHDDTCPPTHWQPILPEGYVLFNEGLSIVFPNILWANGVPVEPVRIVSQDDWGAANPGYLTDGNKVQQRFYSNAISVKYFLEGGRVVTNSGRVLGLGTLSPIEGDCASSVSGE